MISQLDTQKILFPGGVVCEVAVQSKEEKVKRIELISRERMGLGVLKELYVTYASHPALLELSRRSNNVVEVRSIKWSKKHSAEAYSKDLVIVKRLHGQEEIGIRLLGAEKWIDHIRLEAGDKVILSNPLSDYLLPPPSIPETFRT